jgi:uncharacterized protein
MSALRFNVAGLLKEGAGAARDVEFSVAPEDLGDVLEDARPLEPLRGRARLMRTPRSIFVRGSVSTRLGAECSRCLEDTVAPIAFDVEAEYFPEIDVSTGHPLPAPDDDLAFTIDASHELDLGEAIRQHVLLEMPMQTVCSEGCKGLCPRCGANLNAGPCDCPAEEVDDRLAPLRALLEGARPAAE